MTEPSIAINIFLFKINSFENASAVNIGENLLANWNNSSKKNQGFGQNFGDRSEFATNSGVDDRDINDSNAYQQLNRPKPPQYRRD
ncbi:hypothetical protein JOD43_000181 [Pullulanibacillus pueri]|uniref:YozN n=1 Tax=Pullulanibacillus pueri TaxID=1437324 RepID=A0A8J2ZRM9_9BACL|nr:hypothetical protein [Pullulanibacillus pueri]MBM7680022.1 hypothetical protein [Pullulanibacillus pueri]GGH73980.1 hypothetical protein GCM10007096_01760 [Pullulanibacillus pueri]